MPDRDGKKNSAEAVVYIVDDDDAVRDSMTALLGANGLKTLSFASGDIFLDQLEQSWQGCVVLDVRMPGLSGPQVQQALNERKHNLPAIIVTGHGDLPLAVKAMKAGAFDFIEKPFEAPVILEAIDKALALNARINDDKEEEEALDQRISSLTPREREVLVQVAMGNPNKIIAYELAISARTVEIHRARVMEKMGARNLSQLVRLALRAGLLP